MALDRLSFLASWCSASPAGSALPGSRLAAPRWPGSGGFLHRLFSPVSQWAEPVSGLVSCGEDPACAGAHAALRPLRTWGTSSIGRASAGFLLGRPLLVTRQPLVLPGLQVHTQIDSQSLPTLSTHAFPREQNARLSVLPSETWNISHTFDSICFSHHLHLLNLALLFMLLL